VTLVHANALPKIAEQISSGLLMTVNASANPKENACQLNNGTNFLAHAAAQPKIALQNTQISMEM